MPNHYEGNLVSPRLVHTRKKKVISRHHMSYEETEAIFLILANETAAAGINYHKRARGAR